jgi:hypothetical protein
MTSFLETLFSAAVAFAFIYLIDKAFHQTIRDLLTGIWVEIRDFVTLKMSPRSINMLGGIFLFAITLLIGMGEAGDRLLALAQFKSSHTIAIPASILLLICAFLIASITSFHLYCADIFQSNHPSIAAPKMSDGTSEKSASMRPARSFQWNFRLLARYDTRNGRRGTAACVQPLSRPGRRAGR